MKCDNIARIGFSSDQPHTKSTELDPPYLKTSEALHIMLLTECLCTFNTLRDLIEFHTTTARLLKVQKKTCSYS